VYYHASDQDGGDQQAEEGEARMVETEERLLLLSLSESSESSIVIVERGVFEVGYGTRMGGCIGVVEY
jgi:hypothetical protein